MVTIDHAARPRVAGLRRDEIAPWWGSAYTLCIEPLSSCPMDYEAAVRQGTALRLRPGESLPFEMVASVYAGTRRVQGMTADGTVIPG